MESKVEPERQRVITTGFLITAGVPMWISPLYMELKLRRGPSDKRSPF